MFGDTSGEFSLSQKHLYEEKTDENFPTSIGILFIVSHLFYILSVEKRFSTFKIAPISNFQEEHSLTF